MAYRILQPPPQWLNLEQVEAEADRLVVGRNLWLLFPPALEKVFQDERTGRRQQHLARMGLLLLIFFDMFLVGDYLAMPEHMVRAMVVRLAVVTPGALLALWMLRRGLLKSLQQEAVVALLATTICAGTLFLYLQAPGAALMEAVPGVLLTLLAMNTLLRPDLWAALAGTTACCILFVGFLFSGHHFTGSEQLSMGGQVFWCAFLSLLANSALAREQRFSWLLQMRGRLQHQMLKQANRELLNQSLHDQLTGIPNRAAYERRLAELWADAVQSGESIAAVMVDVDHFKKINDSFGHLYGDRVLQRIANLLEQAMRAELDFVARYGGEEFVVLLPGSTLDSGAQVAERIRTLVQVAGSPAVSRGDAPLPPDVKWSTVSCGVAAIVPTEKDDPRALIDAADAALYRAKQLGRNRVCTSGALSLVRTA